MIFILTLTAIAPTNKGYKSIHLFDFLLQKILVQLYTNTILCKYDLKRQFPRVKMVNLQKYFEDKNSGQTILFQKVTTVYKLCPQLTRKIKSRESIERAIFNQLI